MSRYDSIIKMHSAWLAMKQRCYNPKNRSYKHYGGRGIKMCERWEEDFDNFYDDVSMMPHFFEDGRTLDRIDVNGNYEPTNCRWATNEEQANNKRNNRYLEYNGKRQTIAKWAKELQIPMCLISQRLSLGWSVEKALSKSNKKKTLTYSGQTLSIKQWAVKMGISTNTIYARLRQGWSVEKTLTTPIYRTTWDRPQVKESLEKYSRYC